MHSREVDRQSRTGLIFYYEIVHRVKTSEKQTATNGQTYFSVATAEAPILVYFVILQTEIKDYHFF